MVLIFHSNILKTEKKKGSRRKAHIFSFLFFFLFKYFANEAAESRSYTWRLKNHQFSILSKRFPLWVFFFSFSHRHFWHFLNFTQQSIWCCSWQVRMKTKYLHKFMWKINGPTSASSLIIENCICVYDSMHHSSWLAIGLVIEAK